MMRSMFSGVSGLRNHQVKMDVIGNNIANVNTQGFKGSRTTFKEMYNQTMRSTSAPTTALGGVNAMQIGLGTTASSIDMMFGTGSTQTTDRSLDLAIEGEGFFAVNQGETTFYTRAGNLYLDANGFLITSSGMYVQGIHFDIDEQLGNISGVSYTYEDISPAPTDATLAAAWQAVKDSFDYDGTMISLSEYNDDGAYGPDDPTARADNFNNGAGPIMIPSTMTNISISQDGKITGMTPGGDLIEIGAVSLVTFVNPGGLDKVGENLYQETRNSGEPVWHRAADGDGAGDIKSGSLEMSNVDLSKEFTEMIITQRGFQANSRIITVSDTLLEELINLKR